jgi:hypothetical protein
MEFFFTSHFSAPVRPRLKLDRLPFPSLSISDNVMLTNPFNMEEIEDVVKGCDRNKSPGPDGFNFAFIKKCWELLKGEIRVMFD